MNIPPVKLYFPENDKKEILRKIEECLSTGQLTLGKYGNELEEKFVKFVGASYAVAVGSGTSALEIILRIFEIEEKEVLVPTNTFFATPASVIHAGGKVRFVDCDPSTFSIEVEDLKRKITEKSRGVIVVHVGGIITPKMEEIQKICEEKGLFLLEDAAHAHGSKLNGKMAGNFGQAAAFSFYPTKLMSCAEGGMITTNSEIIRDEAIKYRDQGKESFTQNIHTRLGYNWRMSELHAILGLSQLSRLEEFIKSRNRIAKIYDEGLKAIPNIELLIPPQECQSNYYKYIALLERGLDRTILKRILKEKYGVGLSGEVYEIPCHLQPIFQRKCPQEGFPEAEEICRRHICLPIFPNMSQEEAYHVLTSLERTLKLVETGGD